YFGVGFYGGYWNGGRFFYNSAYGHFGPGFRGAVYNHPYAGFGGRPGGPSFNAHPAGFGAGGNAFNHGSPMAGRAGFAGGQERGFAGQGFNGGQRGFTGQSYGGGQPRGGFAGQPAGGGQRPFSAPAGGGRSYAPAARPASGGGFHGGGGGGFHGGGGSHR
ncbi:MAG TPA: hypothetical protein VKV02_10355, partial [Acidobacteriaceae bacterium]|nr:hypothetical protein [Acidobacteriaceae bacterium]